MRWETTPSSRIAALARKGVPDRLRSQVWMHMACGNDAALNELEQSYKYLLGQDSPSKAVILWDLERTFPAHEKYREKGGEGQQQLFRVNAVRTEADGGRGRGRARRLRTEMDFLFRASTPNDHVAHFYRPTRCMTRRLDTAKDSLLLPLCCCCMCVCVVKATPDSNHPLDVET